jgi:hypothetical protein
LTQLAALRRVLAQGGGARGAVVVGVNKTGNLPILRAAVDGAKSVTDWLTGEGFEVKLITDEAGPVTADSVKRAVTELVNRGTLHQLVVYFSGHGVAFGTSEFCLLTGAPDDLNEAVSMVECIDAAGRSGIPNVIFMTDACRSLPIDYDSSKLHGTIIFPKGNIIPGAQGPEVDRFFAATPGAPSYEISVAANNYTGIFTSTLLDAFKHPQAGMVTKVDDVNVVTNRALKGYLLKEVPARLTAARAQVVQYPDAKIESPDRAYIGRALADATAAVSPPRQPTIAEVANQQLSQTGLGPWSSPGGISAEVLAKAAHDTGFVVAKQSILVEKHPQSFQVETGLTIKGAVVRDVWVAGAIRPEIVSRGSSGGEAALVRIPTNRAVTVALLFEDGAGTVVAALPRYIGTLAVDSGRVMNLSYAPSDGYGGLDKQIEELHASVATAAKFGAFRIEGDRETRTAQAAKLAGQIRMGKDADPTLGIYAAYAYADANITEQAQSVRSYMRMRLNVDLFDVALMAGGLSGQRIDVRSEQVVPFCPMLTQGWQLLRVRDVTLSEDIQKARDFLRPALWTTIGPQGMEYIDRGIRAATP